MPITLVVPYAPGGGSDLLGRVLAEGLQARLNETVVVQNLAGAGSVVGSQQVAKAKPDGYTLLLNHIGLSTVPALYKKLALRPARLLRVRRPLCRGADDDHGAQGVRARRLSPSWSPTRRRNKDKFTMASAGMGSSTHLCAMLFQEALGVPITIVQYKGAGPAVIDVRSGQVDAICDLPTTTSGLIRSRRPARLPVDRAAAPGSLPDVPTSTELGVPSLDIGVWFGLYAPLGTPQPIIMTLNKALREIVQDKAVAEKLASIETYLLPLDQATPEAHRAKLASQIALWTPIIEKAGIQAE